MAASSDSAYFYVRAEGFSSGSCMALVRWFPEVRGSLVFMVTLPAPVWRFLSRIRGSLVFMVTSPRLLPAQA